MYRQGDLLIVPLKGPIPSAARTRPDGVILRGEATGHAHRIDPASARVFDFSEKIYLKVMESVSITHEEHAPIPLAPGAYEIIRQREFAGRTSRNVHD